MDYFTDDKNTLDLDKVDYCIKDDSGAETTLIQHQFCPFLEDKIVYAQAHDLSMYDYKALNQEPIAKYLTLVKVENRFRALDAVTSDNHLARQRRKDEKRNNKKTIKHYK